jgi:type IV secretion system protein VirD4
MIVVPVLVWLFFAFDLVLGVIFLVFLNRVYRQPDTGDTVNEKLLRHKPQGFIFGKKGFFYVGKDENDDGHVLVLGGSGSGKTTSIAIPSLISWRARAFVVDIKGELYQKTRQQRPSILAFNPLDKTSCGYNPYYLLRGSRNLAGDARQIALSLIVKSPDVREPFWTDGAQNLFTGAILHYYLLGYTFIKTIETIQDTSPQDLVKAIHSGKSTEARRFVGPFVALDIKTLYGVYAELCNRIMIFATDPVLRKCLSKERFIKPTDLEYGYDVYLLLPEDKLEQWQGLVTLIVNQFLKHFERRGEDANVPILFLLDEFPRLGKVEAVKGLATLRSKSVHICLIVQSLAQLDVIYGAGYRQVIADNCGFKAILNATDATTQEYFSRLVGTQRKAKTTTSTSFKEDTEKIQSTSISETTEEKRLIKPEEFATLQDIVLLTPYGYSRIKKTSCYRTRAFKIPRKQTHRSSKRL